MRLNKWKPVLIVGLLLFVASRASAQAPIVASINPTSGPISAEVTINGNSFGAAQGTSTVTLNGISASVVSWSDSAIVVVVPAAATSGLFSVTVASQVGNSSSFTVTPVPVGWANGDVGSVGATGSATYANGTFTVNGAGFGMAGTADSMQYAYQPLSGDGTIIARVVTTQTAYTQAGVMIRETLNSNASTAYVFYQNYINFYERASTGASIASEGNVAIPGLPYWVKLVRAGNTFAAYSAPDGVNWAQLGTTQTITMATSVYVGLAVSSQTGSTLAAATFDNVSISSAASSAPIITGLSATAGAVGSRVEISGSGFGRPQNGSEVTLNGALVTIVDWDTQGIVVTIPSVAASGPLLVLLAPSMNASNYVNFTVTTQPDPTSWLDQDVGIVGATGSSTFANGVFTVSGAGLGITGTADGMHFAYQPLSGDGTIVARILTEQTASTQAGVMIRETLNENASDAYVFYHNYIEFYARSGTGANTLNEGTLGIAGLAYWVKLVRAGSTFSAYSSPDGLNWTQLGTTQTITMATNVYVGLAVSSETGSTLATATFDNVSISSTTSPAPAITGLSATTGAVGSQVVVSGSGFGTSESTSQVLLNGSPLTINSWSPTAIIATIPTGATSGLLAVSVAPSMNDSNAVGFTVTSSPLPIPWLDQDVGIDGALGSATYSAGVFTLNGAGQGIGSTADGLHFVYQPLPGDGSIVARVVSRSGTSTQVGVMIRETLNGSASNGSVFFNNYMNFDYRTSTGGSTASLGAVGISGLPYWVKLVRTGNAFNAYISPDGQTWTQDNSSQTISMATNVYVGLVVSSQIPSTLNTATLDNVSVIIGTTPFVTGVSPELGGLGSSVTVTGSGFGNTQGTSTLTFNGVAATSISSWTNSQIKATVPTGATTGPVNVKVNSIAGISSASFTVIHPVITSLAPPNGEPGSQIIVIGSGFGANQGTGQVSFNGAILNGDLWSDTSITAVVPANVTTGPVTVITNGVTSNGVQFTVTPTLSVTTLNPTSGAVGSSVTITGTGFGSVQSDSVATFDGIPATITSWGASSIVAVVPVGAATGTVNVEVADVTAQGPVFTIDSSLTLTDSMGHQTTYASEMVGGKWYVDSSQGSGCSSCTVRGNIQTQYDNFGNIVLRTDELGHATSYTYDSNQNLLTVSVQAGSGVYATTTYTYNSFGEPLTVTDPLGNVTTNAYDPNGNLLSVTTPAPNGSTPASVTQFAYNSLGEMTQITDPLGRLTKLTYTAAGLINTITDAQNNVTTYAYDSRGNRTSVTDAMTNQTTFAYDSGSRLTTITYPGNATTVFAYDYRGRRISVTDQNSKKTTYAYDDADRLTSVTDPNNNVTNYNYDTENNLLSIEDANTHTTSFTYDAYGRVTETTFPSTHYEQYGYDAANNLTSKTDRKGQTIDYVYDDLYRLTQKTYPDSSTVEYVYDLVGKLQQVTDPTGTYGFAYDNMGRLVGSTTKYTFLSTTTYSNAYTYDANSNRASMTDPQNGVTSYVYDTLNRLSTLTPPTAFGSGSFGFTYDALSRRTQMTRPNGVTSNYTYNNLSQLLSVLHQVGASTIDGAVYTVDPAGNRTAKTDKHANVTSNYTYDPLYELTQVTQSTTTTETYSYDPVGNRLSSLGVSPYSVNTSNELTSIPSTTYTYDANGNTLTKVTSSGTTTFGWDYENRLTSVTLPGTGGSLTFKYDPFGRRIYKSSSAGTSIYSYDGINLVEETNASGSVVARYSQGASFDDVLAMLRSGATSYYETDGLGSVTSLSNAAGALAQSYTFDSFGNQTASSGSLTNPFQFTAREFDSETTLYYMRARYFDPKAGRFLSEDPLGFSIGVNFYGYVLNSPVNFVDPAGLSPFDLYNLYEKARKKLKKANCALSAALCNLGEDVSGLNSMSNDAITNTAEAQQNQGNPNAGDLGMQRVQQCLAADQNCKNALEQCIKLALTNPFPPPSWLTDLMNLFSKNPSAPAPPIKRE